MDKTELEVEVMSLTPKQIVGLLETYIKTHPEYRSKLKKLALPLVMKNFL